MRKQLFIAGAVTILGFPISGWFLLRWFEDDALAVMTRSTVGIGQQVLVGILVGIAAGYGAKWLVTRSFMKPVEEKYSVFIHRMNLSLPAIVGLSICAGFGEELFFRGALQPLLGVWLTAIIFVAIHGYLNPFKWRISVYGIYMTVAIAVLGYMTDLQGIWSACVAHTVIDVILFRHLVTTGKRLKQAHAYDEYIL